LEWPKGSGLSPVFAASQWFGAMVDGEIRVAGGQHAATEFQPGEIISAGTAADKDDSKYRWYELRADGSGDWDDWPVEQGAPVDADGNPLLLGDQTIFAVFNDLTEHTEFQSVPMGVEVRQIAWAYDRADILGDVIFIKWQLINKSGSSWNDAYFSIWGDPDLGYASDDLLGCDSTRSIAYCYNGSNDDSKYGKNPPAVGFQMLQGPGTDSSGNPQGMSAFVFYYGNDSPQGWPKSASDVYLYMQAIWRDSTYICNDGDIGIDQSYPRTHYMFSGDPETGEGWLQSGPRDSRFLMSSGPFDLPVWQDQDGNNRPDLGEPGVREVVAAVICARGSSNLNSVTQLKKASDAVRHFFDGNMQTAAAPHQPEVTVGEMSHKIVLSWTGKPEYLADGITPYEQQDPIANAYLGEICIVENALLTVDDDSYNFSGYTIWQYSDAEGSNPVEYRRLLTSPDAESGTYDGPRHIEIMVNKHPSVGGIGDTLVNGRSYYFGVQAEAYCKFAIPQSIHDAATIVSAIPRELPGEQYTTTEGDTVAVVHSAVDAALATGSGQVIVTVVDPSAVTGHDYQVVFRDEGSGKLGWDLIDETLQTTLLADQVNLADNDAFSVVDGLRVKVISPKSGIEGIVEMDPTTGAVYDQNLWGSLNNYGRSQHWPLFIISENAGTDFARLDRFGLMAPKDYEFIFTDDDSTLAFDYLSDEVLADANGTPDYLPFTCWRIDPVGTRIRLPVLVYDTDGNGVWDRNFTGVYGPAFNYLYVYDNAEYKPADVATYISTNDGTVAPGYGPWATVYPAINRLLINMYVDVDGYAAAGDLDADGYFWGPPHAGEHIRINTSKPLTTNDLFRFTAPAAKTIADSLLRADLKEITVVPNPYYGVHAAEDGGNRWVQFTYLPERCTLRIFDLAGTPVRKLEKNDPSTPFLRWDLQNEYGKPVASGIYIYHVDMGSYGIKTGKLAVFIAR